MKGREIRKTNIINRHMKGRDLSLINHRYVFQEFETNRHITGKSYIYTCNDQIKSLFRFTILLSEDWVMDSSVEKICICWKSQRIYEA